MIECFVVLGLVEKTFFALVDMNPSLMTFFMPCSQLVIMNRNRVIKCYYFGFIGLFFSKINFLLVSINVAYIYKMI